MSDLTEGTNDQSPGSPEPHASAVNEDQRKRRESKIKRKQREDREFFKLMVAHEAGRRFLWSILNECHAFEVRFGAGPTGFPDPQSTFMNLGEQQIGQRLYQFWHLKAPEPVMLMLKENDPRFAEVVL